MEFMTIIEAVLQVGFPIVCCIFFLMRLQKQDQRSAEQFDQFTVAINNNTKVIQELCDKLEDGKIERH